MKIICISGKAKSGKDTVAKIIKEILENKYYRVLIVHYADILKYICKTFFDWDEEKDNYGRNLLQQIGTDVLRNKNEDYFVNFIVNILKTFNDEWDYVLIPDTRFENEITKLKEEKLDVTTLRVSRSDFINDLTESQKLHISETSLDSYAFDHHIQNDIDIIQLKNYLEKFVEREMLNESFM